MAARLILTLWRMSTGKPSWKSTVRIGAVCSKDAASSSSSRRSRSRSARDTLGSASTQITGVVSPPTTAPTSALR